MWCVIPALKMLEQENRVLAYPQLQRPYHNQIKIMNKETKYTKANISLLKNLKQIITCIKQERNYYVYV